MTLWEVDIYPVAGEVNRAGERVVSDIVDLGLGKSAKVVAGHGFLVEGDLTEADMNRIAQELLGDLVVEKVTVAKVGDAILAKSPLENAALVCVLPKPGVTDPVADSTLRAISESGFSATAVRTLRKYWVVGLDEKALKTLATKSLGNESIEQIVYGPLNFDRIHLGTPYSFQLRHVEILSASDEVLMKISKEWQLSLTLVEMKTVQAHFKQLGRNPTDAELESVAQTWSEHCSHKTLAGQVSYRDEKGERQYKSMLKETIFAATQQIRRELGDDDWCVSVFKDNAGIVKFDDKFHLAFKVETHNRPSAIEPYGGANTGLGGVIRDTLGTGLGAKPIANTDIFCFAPPDMKAEELPPGVLHPRRIMKGVVAGVRDYGNRMGIPTVNGAIYFDRRYVGNPMVFCGNVGLIPVDKAFKKPQPNDYIVAIGGRTGRDGIHGATFSSVELTSQSEHLSGGAVQIGNAITEKMLMDVLLQARDLNLFDAVTDCGAGGFSSAVGEMGEEIGAEVWLDKAPLKYSGLNYTEIWISESQERMVFAIPPEKWEAFHKLCASENVEAVVIGEFKPTGKLVLKYQDQVVGDMEMEFLHGGRPQVVREAFFDPKPETKLPAVSLSARELTGDVKAILSSFNVASKHWVIRQYDHEVLGGSVIKPLVGAKNDGPSDAGVIRPHLRTKRGAVIACGMNPYFGDFDPYHMAASAIDEAIRNCVAVGADPTRIAILDNFCWGYTDRPSTLGSLVRAAIGCQETAVAMRTPFISGKDSLNNEYSYSDTQGKRQTISIPSTLLISALGQIEDSSKAVTMDLKESGNLLYQIGLTKNEMGGSHWAVCRGLTGGSVPKVDTAVAKRTFESLHRAISNGLVRACHDMSEGGFAVAMAEMAFAGERGAIIDTAALPLSVGDFANASSTEKLIAALYSESNSRFIVEVPKSCRDQFESFMLHVACSLIGEVTESNRLDLKIGTEVVSLDLKELKRAWQNPLDWN